MRATAQDPIGGEADLTIELRTVGAVDADQTTALRDVERPEVDGVDEAEDGRGRGDGQRYRRDGADRESRVAAQRVRSVLEITRKVIEQAASLLVAGLFGPVRLAAKRGKREAACFVRCDAAPNVSLDRLRDMEIELLLELGVVRLTAEQPADETGSAPNPIVPRHEGHVVAPMRGLLARRHSHDEVDGLREPFPARVLAGERPSTGCGQRVVPRAAAVLGDTPRRA